LLDILFNEGINHTLISHDNEGLNNKNIKERKSYVAYEQLEIYYRKNPNWSKEFIT